ncbi:hypothetical protein PP175_15450 [Aneurinibacillus sp. Ricciae_BoGa-3]|uniref:hypothetical protein n=1 Tax=Aneurinibacillus sp. Ricciae_BoGa-3 TaxID=3022697 RepID=UPI00233FE325|nr:hypothetical protein [Aneurinibacillus sp. Ricciae_BoGa-3]WCK52816.1 hypothetical protein PP175_15450 [Aneurinibacillus sp. Ricciae_BoGa-3]
MNKLYTLVSAGLASAILLAGCGSANNASSQPNPSSTSSTTASSGSASSNTAAQSNNSTQAPAKEQNPTVDIKTGTVKLLAVAGELKKQLAAGEADKVKATGPQLEESWKTFEDGVKPKYADLYGKIEEHLNPAVTASQANPMDKKVLGTLVDQLSQDLKELQAKEK